MIRVNFVVLFIFLISFPLYAQVDKAETGEYVEGQILVRYLSSIPRDERSGMIQSMGCSSMKKDYIVPNLELVKLPKNVSVQEAIKAFEGTEGVLYASPNYIIDIGAGMFPPGGKFPEPLPDPKFDDPLFYRSYGISHIGASKSWDAFSIGSRNVIVAVVDTGIDYSHEDLRTNMWVNAKETPGNGIDDDQNGFTDDVYGWNFVDNSSDPFDDNHHGTHVAGTIGAVAGNHLGTIGVSPQVSLMALKFLDKDGRGSTEGAIQAIAYAISNGAKILNNSWGGPMYSKALLDAISSAEKMGVLVVAAAGNWDENSDEHPLYPASYDNSNIISVASTDRDDQKSYFSNYGKKSVDIGAPGSYIYSTFPSNLYGNLSGTSMATPHVAGAAALIWAYKPSLSVYDLKDLILRSGDPVEALKEITVSGARLNVYNAMALAP